MNATGMPSGGVDATAPDLAVERAGDRRSPIDRINPVARLLASLVPALGLVLSIDVVSAGVAVAFIAVLLPFARIPPRVLLVRTLPVLIAAPLTGVTILLYGRSSGQVHWEFLLMRVSDGSIELAIATVLRILAIALPAVVLFATVDPTELADGLAQVLRLPARFVLGALAALRLVSLFADDWRALALARRARGVADSGRVRRVLGQAFALLVLAVRRGSALATAMEARGFGAPVERSWARRSRLAARDLAFIAGGVAIAAVAITTSVVSGEWNSIVG